MRGKGEKTEGGGGAAGKKVPIVNCAPSGKKTGPDRKRPGNQGGGG